MAYNPAHDAAIKAFKAKMEALLKIRGAAEKEVLDLSTRQSTLTPEEKARLTAAYAKATAVGVEIDQLKKSSDSSGVTDSAAQKATRDAVRKQLLTVIKDKLPPPAPGTVYIAHPEISMADLVSYMECTQHLNPYGRDRQCDRDLLAIIGLLGVDAGSEIAEWIEITTNMASAAV